MLERGIQLRQTAQQLGFVLHQLVFPLVAPVDPVRPDIFQLLDFAANFVLQIGPLAAHGCERAAGFFEGFERCLNAGHHVSIEFDLLADMPVERARDGFLEVLDDPIERSAAARVHAANSSYFGFGRIACVQQRHEVWERERGGGDLRMAFADAVAHFG